MGFLVPKGPTFSCKTRGIGFHGTTSYGRHFCHLRVQHYVGVLFMVEFLRMMSSVGKEFILSQFACCVG